MSSLQILVHNYGIVGVCIHARTILLYCGQGFYSFSARPSGLGEKLFPWNKCAGYYSRPAAGHYPIYKAIIMVFMCKYICVCAYVCVCICMYICMYVCMYVCMYECMQVRMSLCLNCMYVCTYKCMNCMYVRMTYCMYIPYIHIYIHT